MSNSFTYWLFTITYCSLPITYYLSIRSEKACLYTTMPVSACKIFCAWQTFLFPVFLWMISRSIVFPQSELSWYSLFIIDFWPFTFVFHKGIEPLSSGRKPDALTAMLMEHVNQPTRNRTWTTRVLFLHAAITLSAVFVEVAGFEPAQQWSNRFTVCPDSPTSAYFQ